MQELDLKVGLGWAWAEHGCSQYAHCPTTLTSGTRPPDPYHTLLDPYHTRPDPTTPYPRQVGIAFSRFQMRHFSARYPRLEKATLSYGPCQAPTLGFVVRHHLETEAFPPNPTPNPYPDPNPNPNPTLNPDQVRRHLEIEAFQSAPFWRLVLALRLDGAAEAAEVAEAAEAAEVAEAVAAVAAVEAAEGREGRAGQAELRYDYDRELYAQADFLLKCAIVSIALVSRSCSHSKEADFLLECALLPSYHPSPSRSSAPA